MVSYIEKNKNDDLDYVEKPKRGDMMTFELAGLGTRLMALFIDGLVLSMIGGLSFAGARGSGGFLVGFVISVAYQWFFLTRYNGQTLGKLAMGIRVIKTDGSPLTGTDAVVRYIGYYVNSLPFLLGLGWIWAAFDRNNQGFHDKMASTYVVKA